MPIVEIDTDDWDAQKAAYQALCKIYFDIAAEVVGEDEVRRRRNERFDAALKELREKNNGK